MKIKAINYGCEELPKKAYYDDAGADVRSMERVLIRAMGMTKVKLGFGVELPRGLVGYIMPRTSTGSDGLLVVSPPIDCGYDGEVSAILINFSVNDRQIEIGDKVAQLVIMHTELFELSYEDEKKRGNNAFGSTGYNN